MVLTFPAPVEVTQFGIVVGYDRDEEIFFANHRLRRARLEFDNGTGLVVEFQDQRGMQRINIPPTLTQTIAIVIEDVYSGARYDDTPIAEVEIWGNAP